MRSALPWHRRFHAVAPVLAACLIALLLITIAIGRAGGDEPQTGEPDQAEPAESVSEPASESSGQAEPAASPSIRLPTQMPDGRWFSPIALFQSQMAELIPSHFRPIPIDRLNEAVAIAESRATDDRSSRLRSSLYVVELVDDTLISNRSVLDIESQRDAVVRLPLGEVNLAIDHSPKPSMSSALNVVPRIETDDQGDLVAVVKGDSAIQFGWSLRGESSGASRLYTLRFPRSPQTRIVLAAPGDVVIEALEGVLRDSPSPPLEIDDPSPIGDIRYYIIDAGGLQRLRLRTRPQAQASEAGALVVRRCSTRYEVDAGGMTWTSRLTVHTPVGSRLPPLDVSHGTVTSISVDSVNTNFSTSLVEGRTARIRIDAPIKSFQASTAPTTVTVTGQVLWDGESNWCELPTLVWRGNRVIFAEATSQVQLVVDNALQVVSWELPSAWGTVSEDDSDGLSRIITAEGPPIVQSQSLSTEQVSKQTSSVVPWSRVRLKSHPTFRWSQATMRLDVGDGVLDAQMRIEIKFDPAKVDPLRINVQPGWTLLSLSFPASGRVIETPNVDPKTRSLVLWPEPSDVAAGVLVIQASGVSRSKSDRGVVAVTPSWFLRPDGVMTDFVAAVVPPPGLNWSGEAATLADRVELSQLPESRQTFFSGVSDDTLIFKPRTGRTPPVSLQPPDITFGVTTTLHLQREGRDIVENLVVETDSKNQLLPQLSIRTGPAAGRPNMRWILRTAAGAAPISLPPSDVRLDNEDTDGQYTIDLSEQTMRGRRLVGRRRYSLDEPLQFRLPTVPGATSQNSEVLLGPGLRLLHSSPSVLRVPVDDETSISASADESAMADGRVSPLDDAPSDSLALGLNAARTVRLRYDAVDQPLITIKKTDVNANLTIVWQENVRVIASSRGTDRVEATYRVSAAEPIVINYEPELQLAEIYRDAKSIDLLTVSQRRDSQTAIVLKPSAKRETIRIVWNRNQIGTNWFRRCRIPKLEVSGVVVSSDYRLVASPDTFAPAALGRGSLGDSQRSSSISMSAGEHAILIRRNTALAVGWLLAAILFSISWHVSRRSPLVVAVFVATAVTTALLWWPWHIAIVGWIIVPAVAAGLLATSLAWRASGSQIGAGSRNSLDSDAAKSSSSRPDDSEGFSLATPILLAALLTWAVTTRGRAEDAESKTQPAFINVLVPVDSNGRPMGDKVYIPGAFHAELFRVEANDLPQAARFLLADYRVKLQPKRDDTDQNKPRVEAEYVVHVDRPANRVRLPLPPTSVRRIELIQADQDRIVQFVPDSEDGVIVTLPKSDAFRLRLTLIPTVTHSPDESKLRLTIPPIASSRLMVEAAREIGSVEITDVTGRVTKEPDLGRWVADLGPIAQLEISYESAAPSGGVVAPPLVRRYWVHVAKTGATVDCEVEPMSSIRRGGTVQLVVRDSMIPTVISPTWRLQRSELLSPTRRLITFESLSDLATPIQLMWSSLLPIDRGESEGTSGVVIPEVIAPAGAPNSAAWIAIDSDPSLQVRPIAADPLESLAVDQFLAAWKGYRGQIDRAFVAINDLPMLEVTRVDSAGVSVQQQHDVRVMLDELQLRFTATTTGSDEKLKRRTLRYPLGVDLRQLLVNGQPLDSQPIRTSRFKEVPLPSIDSDEPLTVELTAVASLPRSGRFSLPRFQIWPRVKTTDRYSLSRDQASNVSIVKPVHVASETTPAGANAESLAEGGIPVTSWLLNSDSDSNSEDIALSKGMFKVAPRDVSFTSHQLIVLSWDEGRWDMETFIRFGAQRLPDFVDVQIPTRWCDSLEVSPATTWSRQQAIDPSFQIVRIRCDAESLRDSPLVIRGQLVATDKGRVTVPRVAVLGRAPGDIEISVPDQLANESIQWRFSSVRGIDLPDLWKNELPSTESRSTYAADSPTWSIELAPLRQMELASVAVSSDVQVFSKNDGTLVLCRWDLVPAGLNSVSVRLPRGAVCLGAWTADRAVEIESRVETDTAEGAADSDAATVVYLPLSLSRLLQPVEVLLRVPISSAKQADYLPELVDIPVVEQWVAIYEPQDTAMARSLSKQVENEGITLRHPVPLQSERAAALARSLANAVDQSLNTPVERPPSEIATWLAPWVARYRQIAESAGHQVNWDLSPANESTGVEEAVATRISGGPNTLSSQPWFALDASMSEHVRKFLPDQADRFTPQFGVAHFDGFVLTRVTRVSSHDRLPAVQPASASARDLQFMLMNFLTLGMVCGVLCLLWPMRHYAQTVVVHPAFWLGLIGVFGFFVAPAPVAASVVLVAIALPAFPRPKLRLKKTRFVR